MKTSQNVIHQRSRHHAALAALHKDPAADGLKIWRQLRRLERIAHDAATAQCNGEAYNGQPFRPDHHEDGSEGTESNPTAWEAFAEDIAAKVAKIFGGQLPAGFMFNQDARGYALKINPEKGTIPEGMSTDWGSNGILAAEIE